MINKLKESLWRQFGAGIDMLENAILFCPDDFYVANKHFFYNSFHCLIFLDYYLTIPPKDFSPYLPFTITEVDGRPKEAIDDLIPDKFYSRQELLYYLQLSRKKCHQLIDSLTEEKLNERFVKDFVTDAMDYSILEILLYNMRHVQHHTAQLNLLLRQGLNNSPSWVFRANEKEES